MGIVANVMSKLQEARLEVSSRLSGVDPFDAGVISGLEQAEEIMFLEQQRCKKDADNLWYTGSPNDIKANNTGTYLVIMKAGFTSDDGVEKDQIYIDADFWNGEEWEVHEFGEGEWELLYFTKLKWVRFPLPESLGIKKSDKMFLN